MAPLPFWLLSCAVSLCFIFCATDAEEVFVRSPEAETNCSSHEPCFTLSEYAQEADQYFMDNATITFMSGSHQLDTPLNLNGLSNVVLRVMDEVGTAQVNFGLSVNIVWTDCLNISISGIAFDITGLMSEGDFSALEFRGTSLIFLSDLTLNGSGWWRAVLLDGGDQISVSSLSVFGAMSTRGSAVHASESSIDFYGKNKFTNNNATKIGGAIALKNGYSNLFEDFLFSDNSARYGGAVFISGGSLNMSGSFTFLNNAALVGGAMTIANSISDFSISGNISFTNNTATIYGGALHFHVDGHPYTKVISGRVSFVDNTASNGGAVSIEALSNLTMSGNVSFFNNTAKSNDGFGGAVYVVHGGVIFSGEVWFIDNSAIRGGAITLEHGTCHLSGDISFISNTATTEGGAMLLHNPEEIVSRLGREIVLYMTGNVSFSMNSAEQGGAIVFRDSARLMLTEPLQADFIDNHADTYGGAVFVSRDTTIRSLCFERPSSDSESPLDECFFELDSESNIHLNFSYNSAGNAGAVLFGGNLERCEVKIGGTRWDPLYVLQEKSDIFEILSDDNITSAVSSEPLRVYICEEASNSKLVDSLAKQIIRGREMVVFVDIVGQGNGTVPSSVRVSLNNDIGLDAAQRIQKTEKGCTHVSYRLKNKQNTTTVTLFPDEGPCRGIGISSAVVNVTFLPCPDGFTRDGSACACEERLQLPEYNVTCSVDDNSIFRRSNSFWMGTVYDNETYEGLILHDGCPLDYCTSSPVNFTLDNLDGQCDHNRSGILCGSCQDSHSIAFGSLHCLPCSNENLSLILPFALAGIALVATLLILQLSATANGTFSGLIFYANVVQANRSLFIPLGDTNVLTIFIAWLNLDLGIETCFYDGMNAYAFTWLQFLFPFYVWILIGLIIVMSHYSRRVSKIFGTNPVAALATLLLLSYSKFLQTVIFALSYTTLVYPDNTPRHVWLYDGSVPYFQRADHIVLGIFAITVLLFLFLPYTLLLLCGHWLQACSNRKFLSWINKIMPFLNAYYAPFKKETRYWTGLILLVRCGVFIAFSFNVDGNADTKINLLIISTVTVCLATVAWLHHGIYERFYNDLLEGSFILNLCLFAAATYHVEDQAALAYSSIGIAFATFVCIVLFHIYLVLHNTPIWKKTVGRIKISLRTEHGRDRRKSSNKLENRDSGVRGPTITFLELRESLLVINVQNQPQTVQTEC